jgi:cell division protein FtsZ
MDEVFEITEYVQEEAGYGTDLIWGNCYDENLGEQISVTVIATGFETGQNTKKAIERVERPVERKVRVALDDEEETSPRPTNFFGDNEGQETIEFNLSKKKQIGNSSKNEETKPKYSIEKQPFVKPSSQEPEQPKQPQPSKETLEERRQRLKNLSVKLNNPEVLNELENKPAYLRKGIALDNVEHSSQSNVSKWSISDEDEPEIKDNNSFLHDNVD